MARLCRACQTTMDNHLERCPTCGRHRRESDAAWDEGSAAWLMYLDQSGWYPGRRDEWLDRQFVRFDLSNEGHSVPPRRLIGRYLGGHPALNRPSRVILTRVDGAVVISTPSWWPWRSGRVAVPLSAVKMVQLQRTTENTPDEAVVTAAIGGARTGPLGMMIGSQIARRRRVFRTVHVHLKAEQGPLELVFRSVEDQGANGPAALVRIFQAE